MTIALSLLALLAIVAAIGAASRVQKQLADQAIQSGQIQGESFAKSAPQERESLEAQKSRVESDRDRDQALTPSSSQVGLEIDTPSELHSEASLAASLTITEAMHPSEVEVSIYSSSDLEESPDEATSSHLLAELEQLEHSDHHTQITHLSRYVEHSDSTMRVAAAFALGELLAKSDRSEREEILALLHQFNQDANSQVRQQAVTAFAKMQLP